MNNLNNIFSITNSITNKIYLLRFFYIYNIIIHKINFIILFRIFLIFFSLVILEQNKLSEIDVEDNNNTNISKVNNSKEDKEIIGLYFNFYH